jgi:UDP-3-O-[3-hydroxymyristoyl] glucosamine N-acyltransferase
MRGGQAGIVGHLTIADGSKINAQSGVAKSLKENAIVTGSPAFEYNNSLRSQAIFRNLPELENRVKALEKLIQELITEKSSS